MVSESEVAFLLAGDQQAQFYLAEAYVKEDWKLEDAEILLRKFLSAPPLPPGDDPTPADAHVLLGRVLLLRGQRGAAIEEFRRALLSNPESSEARIQLSRLGG
jgi:tetratricopeptide (TPR) repeat protein